MGSGAGSKSKDGEASSPTQKRFERWRKRKQERLRKGGSGDVSDGSEVAAANPQEEISAIDQRINALQNFLKSAKGGKGGKD